MCCIMLVSLVVFGVEKPHPAKTAQARFNIIQRSGGGALQTCVKGEGSHCPMMTDGSLCCV